MLEYPSPRQPLVPTQACHITTPPSIFIWKRLLYSHPYQELVNMFLNELTYGFRIGFSYSNHSLQSANKNKQSALEHPEAVDVYLAEELENKQIIGPFS